MKSSPISVNHPDAATLGILILIAALSIQIVALQHQLAGRGFKGTALGDLSYRGERLSKTGGALGITIQPSAGGHGGTFIPEGIRWVVERSLGWVSRYRRLNTIFERTEAHLVAFIEIAFISILSRRLVRLAPQEIGA
ncbi:transposase (plasmid) [Skermanella mucosa]|uniref:transposase n=1 Tax=Skermanella mucosa TaxID=1789672 RepID=UPI001E640EA9|nr:transposase [Skermanella mucosa]UEM24277.1 transposase [Skermanella mucosa]